MTQLPPELEMSLHELDYGLIEFRQKYAAGQTVHKRGLDATPLVVRKYRLGRKEVMCFSSHERRNRALTAFHFHPDFPRDQRRAYMEAHLEGQELAQEIEQHRARELRQKTDKWKSRLDRSAKTLGVLLHSLVIYAITHHTDSH